MRHTFYACLLLCGACLLLGSGFNPARAEGAAALNIGGAPFGIRSAYLQLVNGVYLLSGRLYIPVDPQLREALADGVALKLELDIEISRARSFWLSESVAALVQQYQLQYHAISDRYVVRNLNSGEQISFPSFEPAIEYLTHIANLPTLDRALIRKDRDYQARMRAVIDVGEMPAALRWLMFWENEWHRVSEWYTWSLPQSP